MLSVCDINISLEETYEKLVLLATAAAVLVSVPAIGSAANIKSVLNKNQTVTYQGVKLSEGVTMYQIILKHFLQAMQKRY